MIAAESETARPTRISRRALIAAVAPALGSLAAACGRSRTAASPASPRAVQSATAPVRSAGEQYFPPAAGEWERADAASAGWSAQRLQSLVQTVKDANSATFMMLAGGRILVEEYFIGGASDTHDVASVQKSITSTLLGIARDKGLLGLDDKVPKFLGHGWSNASPAEEDAISIRHLMTHSSGLNPNTLRKTSEPGKVFEYNTEAYQKLRPLLEKAAGSDINSISRAWLFDTIGVPPTSVWRVRPDETDATGAAQWGMAMTARDMSRFGLLAQRGGRWSANQAVPAGWFEEAWTPCAVRADYGLLWWLMGRRREPQGTPGDWVAALGAMDQKIYVVPSLDLVLARQGLAAKEASEAASNFDAVLIKAVLAARA